MSKYQYQGRVEKMEESTFQNQELSSVKYIRSNSSDILREDQEESRRRSKKRSKKKIKKKIKKSQE